MMILITGVSGFLGKNLANKLLSEGHHIIGMSRKPVDINHANYQPVCGDLTSKWPHEQIFWETIDAVFHLAAAGVKSSARVWHEALETNVGGTINLLSAIRKYAKKKPQVIVARSFYEDLISVNEELRKNPYVATKAAASAIAREWAESYTGRVQYANLFQLYGPGDAPGAVLSYAAHQLAKGLKATFGSGSGQRDWLYVTDAAAALSRLLLIENSGGAQYDIGSGKVMTLREMVCKVADNIHGGIDNIEFNPELDRGDLNFSKSASVFPVNWAPQVGPDEGVRKLVEYSLQNR